MSHSVTSPSSPRCHGLCVAPRWRLSHTVTMNDSDKNAGPNNLEAWRKFRGMTQAALAEAVDTTHNMIGYLESGERALSAKWLRRLAAALDTTPGMLLDHDPKELDADIIDIWASADLRERRQLIDLAKVVVSGKTGTNDR